MGCERHPDPDCKSNTPPAGRKEQKEQKEDHKVEGGGDKPRTSQ